MTSESKMRCEETRILEAVDVVSAMQGTSVRGHTLGISVGNPLSVEPSLDVFNEDAYESIDFTILAARSVSFTSVYEFSDTEVYSSLVGIMGGSISSSDGRAIRFKAKARPPHHRTSGRTFSTRQASSTRSSGTSRTNLTHVNQCTGIAHEDDSTILEWESVFELSAVLWDDGPAPPQWMREIGELINGLVPEQLFFDGTYGIYEGSGQVVVVVVVVMSSDYLHPADVSKLENGIGLAHEADRAIDLEEERSALIRFLFGMQSGGDDVATFLARAESVGVVGGTFWSSFGHDDECCQYVQHNDGFSFYYLREEYYLTRGDVIIPHTKEMTGRQAPGILPPFSAYAGHALSVVCIAREDSG
ncbi:hypothetical protein EW146_g8551 [Bondarzewia mesenterica]|uniref:Uncharacterized protein n=1 Tax=Bondarzewia mesenterica TaxID=1095465 RepID=A0A4S4LFB4_9AGAM|nr:hypothetical protein EW146_g8551 [Bondarzewia mesenterica]